MPPSVPKKRVRIKDPKSGSNVGGRNCMFCGGPKSRTAVPGNLHYTYVKAGQTGYFYCPQKVAAEFSVRDTMTFLEFKASEFWAAAIEQVERDKAEKGSPQRRSGCAERSKGLEETWWTTQMKCKKKY